MLKDVVILGYVPAELTCRRHANSHVNRWSAGWLRSEHGRY